MKQKRIWRAGLLVSLVLAALAGALLTPAGSAYAAEDDHPRPALVLTKKPPEHTPPDPNEPGDANDETTGSGTSSDGTHGSGTSSSDTTATAADAVVGAGASVGASVVNNIVNKLIFDFQTMFDGIVTLGNNFANKAYEGAATQFGSVMETLVFGPYGITPRGLGEPPLFSKLIHDHWQVTFNITLMLLPLTLVLTTAGALRQGLSSALGYAELKEALPGWLISVGATAGSYYLLSLAYRLSVGAGAMIASADFGGGPLSGAGLVSALIQYRILAELSVAQPIIGLYLGFFVLFLASAIILGLGLALAAFTALTYMLSVLAPIILTLGVLPPLRWLHALWLKAVTVVFLLPMIDALLLKAAVSISKTMFNAEGRGDWGAFVGSLVVGAGVLSVLIAINFKVGEMVFGSLGEISRKAWDSTMGVVTMAATAIGFVASAGATGGLSALGVGNKLAPAALPAGSPPAGPGNNAPANSPTGQTPPAKDLNGHTAAQTPTPNSGSERPASPRYPTEAAAAARRAQIQSAIGGMLGGTRNPVLGGLGRGMQAGAGLGSAAAGAALNNYSAARTAFGDAMREQTNQETQARQQQQDTQRAEARQETLDYRNQQAQAATQRQADYEYRQAHQQTLYIANHPPKGIPQEIFARDGDSANYFAGALYRASTDSGFALNTQASIYLGREIVAAAPNSQAVKDAYKVCAEQSFVKDKGTFAAEMQKIGIDATRLPAFEVFFSGREKF